MFTATRIESTIKPNKFESLNNGIWYYNYDISKDSIEDEIRYNFIQVRIQGKPTYKKCVEAIIRQYITQNEEFNLINSYNSYQLDISSVDAKYKEYLQLIKTIKANVSKDFFRTVEESTDNIPKQSDIVRLLLMTINTLNLNDQQSLSVKSLYPDWNSFIGNNIDVGIKIKYNNRLFKVVQQHIVQEQYPPSIDTASLYTEIVEDHSGTIDNPIPYSGNMIIYVDKYYIEDGIIYKCIRNSDQPLYSKLSNLVDNYVEEIDNLL